jgi:predicted double-glycine peptidase
MYELQNFVFLQQKDSISCGPTSCTMVLNYYKRNYPVEQIKSLCKTSWFSYGGKEVGMTSPDSIAATMWRCGVPVRMGMGDIKLLKYYVSNNRPPMVLLRSSEKTWHYVIVIGYDEENIITADPAYGQKKIVSTEIFKGAWDFSADTSGEIFNKKFDIFLNLVNLGDVFGNSFVVPLKKMK